MLVLLVLLLACSDDPVAPCSGCGTRPAELEIASLRLVTAGSSTHPLTGLPIVDSLRVRYVVRNAGDSASLPAQISFSSHLAFRTDNIPALPGGDSIARSFVLPRRGAFYDYDTNPAGIDWVDAWLDTLYAVSDSVHRALPILQVTLAPPPEPHVRVNDPLRLTATITNHSVLVPAQQIQLRHCLWDYDVACWAPQWTAFGTVPLPDLAPGETRSISYTTAITPTAMEEGYFHLWLEGCVTPRSDTGAYRPYPDDSWICAGSGHLEVWPDFEACAPPLLGAQPVTLSARNCGIYPPPPDASAIQLLWLERKQYYVFALELAPGRSYRISGLASIDLRNVNGRAATDLDPAPDRVAVSQGGRYYLVSYTVAAPLTVSAAVVP